MHKPRGHARHEMTGIVELRPEAETSQGALKAELVDFGFGGFRVRAKQRLEPESVVVFDVLTDVCGEHLIGKGQVKYVVELKRRETSFTIGVAFLEVKKELVISCMNLHKAKLLRAKQDQAKPKTKYEGPF